MENENIESPLEGLIDKPLHEMTDDELRAFIEHKRALVDSSQARAAYFRGTYEKKEKPSAFDEF